MKTFFKILASLITLTLTVVLVAFFWVVNLDPNEHKAYIADKFRDSTGLELELNGDIAVSLYPWLGVTVDDVVVHNAPGFSDTPLLESEQAAVRVKLLPMLDREYQIDTIRLVGTRIHLETNAAGMSNWNSAMPASQGTTAATPGDDGQALNDLVIGGVDIRNAALTYDDRFNDVSYAINGLSVSTGELVYGEPVDLTLGFDASATRPALATTVSLTGTVLYDLDNQRYDLSPLAITGTLTGANVPGGSAAYALNTAISLDLASERLTLRDFSLSALDAQVNANINGNGIAGDSPVYQVNLAAAGNDLAVLFQVLENDALVAQINNLDSKAFRINALVESSPNAGTLKVSDLDATLLDATISGDIDARNLQADPIVNGAINARGPDLPTLLEVAGSLQGRDSTLSRYGRELQQAPGQDFLLDTQFDANLGTGNVVVPVFDARLFGATMRGNISARNVTTDNPVVQGRLNASGPDLPILMRIVGQLSGGTESPLNRYGRQLRNAGNRNFALNAPFDIDMASGNVSIDGLDASALGLRLNGSLQARNFQSPTGIMSGQFTLAGRNLGDVLTAIDQPGLAEVVQSLTLNLSVDGTRRNLSLSPLDLDVVLAGSRIPNSPVTLTMKADSVLDLEADTLDTRNFSVAGLGLNLGGSISASAISTNPAYTGNITLPAFNLRRFLQQLNQAVPATTDNTVFQSLAVSTDFAGSDNDLRLNNLALVLDESTITGDFTVAGLASSPAAPAMDFDLDIDTINLDRYLAPESPDTAMTNTELPTEDLRRLNLKGNLDIGRLTYANLRMADFVLAVNASDGDLALSPIAATLYQGRYEGEIRLNTTGAMPVASVDTSLAGINLGPLMQDFMGATYVSGTGNIDLSLTGRGADTATIKRNLNGAGSLALVDGVLQGVDVGSVLRQIEIMIRDKQARRLDRGERTPFETFTANIDVANGIVSSNDLLIESSGFDVTGRGTLANLNDDTIDFRLQASVDETPASDEQAYDIGGYTVPIACTGALASPSCLPDIQAILAGAITSAVQRGLTNLLERAVGGQQQSQDNNNGDSTSQDSQQQDQQPEETDPREELINRALDSLFKRN